MEKENIRFKGRKLELQKKRLEFITVLYGLAAILVVLGHSHPLHIGYPAYMQKMIRFIYLFHMPLFFFIAGILVAYTDEDRNRDINRWWRKKIVKLMVPYFVLTIVAWGPKILLGKYMTDDMEVSIGNFIRILLIPRENIWGHFWYIPVYLFLTLIGAIIWKYYKRLSVTVQGIGGVCIIALTLFPIPITWLGVEDISKELFYIVAGMLISDKLIRDIDKIKVWPGIAALGLAGILFYIDVNLNVGRLVSILLEKVISLLMIEFVVMLSVIISNQSGAGVRTVLDHIGKCAFTIYIYSWPVQAMIEMVVVVVLGLSWHIAFFMMFLSGVCTPMAVYKIYVGYVKKNVFLDMMIGAN